MEKEEIKKRDKKTLLRAKGLFVRGLELKEKGPVTSFEDETQINSTDGKATIFGSKELFKGGVEEEYFKKINNPSNPTESIKAKIHRVNKKKSLFQIFHSINPKFDNLLLKQSQIIDFCNNDLNLFKKGWSGFLFLTKETSEYTAILVAVKPNGLEASLYRVNNTNKITSIFEWISYKNLRIITPDLTII